MIDGAIPPWIGFQYTENTLRILHRIFHRMEYGRTCNQDGLFPNVLIIRFNKRCPPRQFPDPTSFRLNTVYATLPAIPTDGFYESQTERNVCLIKRVQCLSSP